MDTVIIPWWILYITGWTLTPPSPVLPWMEKHCSIDPENKMRAISLSDALRSNPPPSPPDFGRVNSFGACRWTLSYKYIMTSVDYFLMISVNRCAEETVEDFVQCF